jgi:hypothetical protein
LIQGNSFQISVEQFLIANLQPLFGVEKKHRQVLYHSLSTVFTFSALRPTAGRNKGTDTTIAIAT